MRTTTHRTTTAGLILVAAALACGCGPQPDDGAPADAAATLAAPAAADKSARSRALALRLATELKTELQQALSSAGPAAAVQVCRDRAPAIGARLSAESGALVGRTGLRVRNSGNAPLPWQRAVLEQFAQQGPLTPSGEAREVELTPADGPDAFRYMQAIPTGGLCLTCHGRDLAPDVQDALRASYPDDAATGYDVGQLRGAFVVTWPRQP